ncbi:hypothetical protein CHARACLAT_025158 [Characodon lateralis]|uniref:Uncharacterized protein n=1 Tax=Characodon lateralis TaxID=208331 RepID=A0ABU7EWK2_9TELE|nr:hypothetical protein [Characodon lateralis]
MSIEPSFLSHAHLIYNKVFVILFYFTHSYKCYLQLKACLKSFRNMWTSSSCFLVPKQIYLNVFLPMPLKPPSRQMQSLGSPSDLAESLTFFVVFSLSAKPQTSLRQPNHRGRGGGRGGGGAGRGAGHGDFRQTRDLRDGLSEGRPGGHPNKLSNQNKANKRGNLPAER